MKHLLVAAAFVLVGLAGCSDSPKGPDDDTFDDFDVDVDGSTGVIRGLVVDASVTPIAAANVHVLGAGLNATSNEQGAFVIQLPPGNYFLEIGKPGYDTVQASAEVKAGVKEPPIVRVLLQRLPGSEPRFVALSWDGHLGCTYRRWDPPSGGYGTSCPAVSTVWPDHDQSIDYELEQVPAWVTSDLVWESTQRLGGEMSFNLRRTDGNCDTKDVEGTNPLHLALTPEDIALHSDRCTSQGGFGPDMPLRVIIFTAHLQETEPPTGGWGFGLQLDQPFTVYTHIFYNYAPPEAWVFTDDGNVPEP